MHPGGCRTLYHFNKAQVVLGLFDAILFYCALSPGAKFNLTDGVTLLHTADQPLNCF